MTDKNLTDRWWQMMKIAPNDKVHGKSSWNENSQNLLSTEKKIFAIRISEGENLAGHQPLALHKKKSKSLALKKWLENSKWRLPKAIILFSVLQLFFHLIGPMNLAYQTLAFSPMRKLELWRYFTYALLHVGTAHLLINVILQLVISFPLESEVGSQNVLFVYIGGILSGSLAESLSPDFTLMVGASSGIYSLLMSHISQICMNFSSISHRTNRIIFVVVLLLSDIVYATIHCLENREPKIAVGSHVAGALSGILLGFIFYANNHHENKELKFKLFKRISIVAYLSFVVVAIFLNVM